MKRPYIILIPVDFEGSHDIAQQFKNKEFATVAEAGIAVTDALQHDEDEEDEQVLFYPLADFVDACNNQELDVLTSYFITNVFITK